MTKFSGDIGLQFTIHIADQYTVPDLVHLAGVAHDQGFDQVWVNDNLCTRNIFVVLSAMAATVPIRLGSAILVPYFRNPVDLADSIAAITELTDGREFSIGTARGAHAIAGQQAEAIKPLATMRETVSSIKALLAGETVTFKDYPNVGAYFHLNPDWEFELEFEPAAPVRFYSGGNGPKILQIAAKIMDGILIGGYYIPLVRTGRLGAVLEPPRALSAEVQPDNPQYDTCELNVSISRNREAAFQFAKPYVSHMLISLKHMGFTDDEFRTIFVEPDLVTAVDDAFKNGATAAQAAQMIPDEAVKSCFVVGEPEECKDQILDLMEHAANLDFGQVCLAKLGPDYEEAITLLRQEVLTD
ncbi:MAG: LLM class flavin-dependent oxidoreductase [Alphaproteobacteria bacterium]|nr:LLM class flavin-dependent oxidoreductase [Alphaproteobacteria bacterium]